MSDSKASIEPVETRLGAARRLADAAASVPLDRGENAARAVGLLTSAVRNLIEAIEQSGSNAPEARVRDLEATLRRIIDEIDDAWRADARLSQGRDPVVDHVAQADLVLRLYKMASDALDRGTK